MARLDSELVARGLVSGRDRASGLIRAGRVTVNGVPVTKPASQVTESDVLEAFDDPYVGRGGLKLARALDAFHIDVTGMRAVDLGASTGGFTDCLLQHGAAFVCAVDVGHDQLDPRLRADSRVRSLEGVNARSLTTEMVGFQPDIITADLSFISQRVIYPVIASLLHESGIAVTLVKPQFEAGRAHVGKGGVVHDRSVHLRVLTELETAAAEYGLFPAGACVSPIRGQDGNIEYLVYYTKRRIGGRPDYAALTTYGKAQGGRKA